MYGGQGRNRTYGVSYVTDLQNFVYIIHYKFESTMFNPNNNFLFSDTELQQAPFNSKILKCQCMLCGRLFCISKRGYLDSKRSNNLNAYKFCSSQCRQSSIKQYTSSVCETCGKLFDHSASKTHKRFCCRSCASKYSNKFSQTEDIKKQKSIKLTKFKPVKQTHNINKLYAKVKDVVDKLYETFNLSDIKNIACDSFRIHNSTFYKILKFYNIRPNNKFINTHNTTKIDICKRVLDITDRSVTCEDYRLTHDILKHAFYNDKLTPSQINSKYHLNLKQPTASLNKIFGFKFKHREMNKSKSQTVLNSIDWNTYHSLCQFRFDKSQYSKIDGFNLLKMYGMWSHDNPNGVARDHKISIKWGYDHNISPSIISHPANCEFIPFRENSSKGADCSITLSQLLTHIDKWS